jgi:hypothetical protein
MLDNVILVRAACVRCHGAKCPLLTAFFPLLNFFCFVYFSPRRGYHRVPKFCIGFKETKRLRFGNRPLPCFFSEKNERCLESPEMARKLIGFPPPRHLWRKVSASVDGGLSVLSVYNCKMLCHTLYKYWWYHICKCQK